MNITHGTHKDVVLSRAYPTCCSFRINLGGIFSGGFMKRLTMILLTGVFIFAGVATQVDAATITVTPPTSPSNPALNTPLANALTAAQGTATYQDAVNTLSKFDNQTDLARGFANANAYSSHAATIQGYQNYDLFYVSVGLMAGIQAPSTDQNYYKKSVIEDDLKSDGDVYAGISAGAAVSFGIHARFIAYGLYLSGTVGSINIEDESNYSFKSRIFGFGINYALLNPHGILFGFLNWRGLSLGTGLIYQRNEASFVYEFDSITQPVTGFSGVNLVVDPSAKFGFVNETYTVPVDIVTSFQLLWLLNITLGGGVDFVTGSTDLTLTSGGDIRVTGTNETITPGHITIDGSTNDVKPSRVRPKLMAGVGLQLGPIKLDVPVIYYPDAGAAVGITAAFVW